MTTEPAFALVAERVILPFEATFEPSISMPSSPLAVKPRVPEAPTWEAFLTEMPLPAVTERLALSSSPISGALPSVGIVNLPALTVAPSIATSLPAFRVTPVSPTRDAPALTLTSLAASSLAVLAASTAPFTLMSAAVAGVVAV